MDVGETRGSVGFGIITIREDEFEAVLERFPKVDVVEARRRYAASRSAPLRSAKDGEAEAPHLRGGDREQRQAPRRRGTRQPDGDAEGTVTTGLTSRGSQIY
jgi:hypothetical protein